MLAGKSNPLHAPGTLRWLSAPCPGREVVARSSRVTTTSASEESSLSASQMKCHRSNPHCHSESARIESF